MLGPLVLSLKIRRAKGEGVEKSTPNLLAAFSREPCISQSPFNGRAIKIGFGAASSAAVLIVHRTVLLITKTPNKCFSGKYKIRNVCSKLNIRNIGNSRAKQYARHQLSRDVDHVPFCIVFLGKF